MSSAEMRPDSCSSASRTRGYRSSVSRSEEHTSELQSPCNLVCRLLLEKKKKVILLHHFSTAAVKIHHGRVNITRLLHQIHVLDHDYALLLQPICLDVAPSLSSFICRVL